MNPNDVAPMIVFTTLIVVCGGVAILRPIARRLGDYLETMTRVKREEPPAIEPRILETLERIDERLRLVEERQDFTDALLRRGESKARIDAAVRPALADPHRPPDVLD